MGPVEALPKKEVDKRIKFFDSHFHIMDHFDPESPHMTNVKDYPHKKKTYVVEHHEKLIMGQGDPINLVGGLFVEVACPPELKHAET